MEHKLAAQLLHELIVFTGMSLARLYTAAEFTVLFILIPVLYWLDMIPFHKIIPLALLFAYCVAILAVHRRITLDRFRIGADWKSIFLRFGITTALIVALLAFSASYPVFTDLSMNTKLMYMLLLYPLLSAFPQELIFREFFFYRYATLFRHPKTLTVVNVLVFAFAHIYFANWVVLVFTLAGGIIFAITYLKTRSLLVVALEHTLYGLLVLSSGLSIHFYKAF